MKARVTISLEGLWARADSRPMHRREAAEKNHQRTAIVCLEGCEGWSVARVFRSQPSYARRLIGTQADLGRF